MQSLASGIPRKQQSCRVGLVGDVGGGAPDRRLLFARLLNKSPDRPHVLVFEGLFVGQK